MASRAWPAVTLLLGGCPLGVSALSVDYPCTTDLECAAPFHCVEGVCSTSSAAADDAGAPVERRDAGVDPIPVDDGGVAPPPDDGGLPLADAGGPPPPPPPRDAGLPEEDAGPPPCSGSYDEDGDGVVDACDVCPVRADPGQEDTDGDGVGDACDPRPDIPRERLLFFDGFNGLTLDPGYAVRGGGGWSLDEGTLVQSSGTVDARLWREDLEATDVIVETAVRFTSLAALYRSTAGPMGRIDDSAVACGFGKDDTWVIGGPPNGALDLYVVDWLSGGVVDAAERGAASSPSASISRRVILDAQGQRLVCRMVDDTTVANVAQVTSGAAGLRTSRAASVFEYLLVIESLPDDAE